MFRKLPDQIDYSRIFDNVTAGDGINLVFNRQGYIISAYSTKVSKLFGTRIDRLVGMNLYQDLKNFVAPTVVGMISEILENVKRNNQSNGCIIDIVEDDETSHYLLLGFSISHNEETLGVFLTKQPFSELFTHQAIL